MPAKVIFLTAEDVSVCMTSTLNFMMIKYNVSLPILEVLTDFYVFPGFFPTFLSAVEEFGRCLSLTG
jgi:hypothetical protein